MKPSVPVDVTAQLRAAGHLTGEHHNDEDLVYELDGVMVKVKTWHEVHALPVTLPSGITIRTSQDVLRVAGSIVGPDGKAIALHNGQPAVFGFGRQWSPQAETETDLVAALEILRFDCVRETLRAHANHKALSGLTGVGRHPVRSS